MIAARMGRLAFGSVGFNAAHISVILEQFDDERELRRAARQLCYEPLQRWQRAFGSSPSAVVLGQPLLELKEHANISNADRKLMANLTAHTADNDDVLHVANLARKIGGNVVLVDFNSGGDKIVALEIIRSDGSTTRKSVSSSTRRFFNSVISMHAIHF